MTAEADLISVWCLDFPNLFQQHMAAAAGGKGALSHNNFFFQK